MFNAVRSSLLSVVFPHDCGVCSGLAAHAEDPDACEHCWDETRFFDGTEMLCGRCGAVLGERAAPREVYCHKCDGYGFDRAVALGVYEKALACSIAHLKREPFLSSGLKRRIVAGLARVTGLEADVLMPVPLSAHRRVERGFNQAETIAEFLSGEMRVPVDSGSLARSVDTPMHRIGMDQKARELTVKKAFKVVRPSLVEDKRVLLVDDVMTSGATTSACALALRKNGAQSVNVFTLARAVMR